MKLHNIFVCIFLLSQFSLASVVYTPSWDVTRSDGFFEYVEIIPLDIPHVGENRFKVQFKDTTFYNLLSTAKTDGYKIADLNLLKDSYFSDYKRNFLTDVINIDTTPIRFGSNVLGSYTDFSLLDEPIITITLSTLNDLSTAGFSLGFASGDVNLSWDTDNTEFLDSLNNITVWLPETTNSSIFYMSTNSTQTGVISSGFQQVIVDTADSTSGWAGGGNTGDGPIQSSLGCFQGTCNVWFYNTSKLAGGGNADFTYGSDQNLSFADKMYVWVYGVNGTIGSGTLTGNFFTTGFGANLCGNIVSNENINQISIGSGALFTYDIDSACKTALADGTVRILRIGFTDALFSSDDSNFTVDYLFLRYNDTCPSGWVCNFTESGVVLASFEEHEVWSPADANATNVVEGNQSLRICVTNSADVTSLWDMPDIDVSDHDVLRVSVFVDDISIMGASGGVQVKLFGQEDGNSSTQFFQQSVVPLVNGLNVLEVSIASMSEVGGGVNLSNVTKIQVQNSNRDTGTNCVYFDALTLALTSTGSGNVVAFDRDGQGSWWVNHSIIVPQNTTPQNYTIELFVIGNSTANATANHNVNVQDSFVPVVNTFTHNFNPFRVGLDANEVILIYNFTENSVITVFEVNRTLPNGTTTTILTLAANCDSANQTCEGSTTPIDVSSVDPSETAKYCGTWTYSYIITDSVGNSVSATPSFDVNCGYTAGDLSTISFDLIGTFLAGFVVQAPILISLIVLGIIISLIFTNIESISILVTKFKKFGSK